MRILANIITAILDYVYNIMRKIIPHFGMLVSATLFRYGCCGVANLLLDWILYFLVYNYVLCHRMVSLSFVTLSSHIASLFIVFPITLLTGFWLNKNITFTQSNLKSRKQLERYMMVVFINLLINYFGLKLLVDVCGLYPTPSKIIVTIVTVFVSYTGQKHFSFKTTH